MKPETVVLDYSVDGLSGQQIGRWLSGPHRIVRVDEGDAFPVIDTRECKAVIHSGSALSILEDPPFIHGAESFVRRAAENRLPQMGICYGQQLIVRALCGREAVERCSSVELGWLPVRFLPEWPGSGLTGEHCVWQSHYDRVNTIPRGSCITATNGHTRIQGFWNREMGLFGTQFHPEMDKISGDRCFSADPHLFEKNGISLEKTLMGGPGFDTGTIVFRHFLSSMERGM